MADEAAALEQFRLLAGGQLAGALDESLGSLEKVDVFLTGLLAQGDWRELLSGAGVASPDDWLGVRVAYYFAACLRKRYGCAWSRCEDPNSPSYGLPVMVVRGIELSPLEIAKARLEGEVQGGLSGLISDLEREIGHET